MNLLTLSGCLSDSLLNFFFGEDLHGVVGEDIAESRPESGTGDKVPKIGQQREPMKQIPATTNRK